MAQRYSSYMFFHHASPRLVVAASLADTCYAQSIRGGGEYVSADEVRGRCCTCNNLANFNGKQEYAMHACLQWSEHQRIEHRGWAEEGVTRGLC